MKRERQLSPTSNDRESLEEWARWADDHAKAIRARNMPWEAEPWRRDKDEPLSLAAVYWALIAVRKGTRLELKHSPLRPQPDYDSEEMEWIEVDHPPEEAVKIITRALQAGAEGRKLIKIALDLKPKAKGAIVARHVARTLTVPEGGWPTSKEEWKRFDRKTVEWIRPSKQQVERELERRYPAIYKDLPKKDGRRDKLRSTFWKDAALKDVIDQTRGYR